MTLPDGPGGTLGVPGSCTSSFGVGWSLVVGWGFPGPIFFVAAGQLFLELVLRFVAGFVQRVLVQGFSWILQGAPLDAQGSCILFLGMTCCDGPRLLPHW